MNYVGSVAIYIRETFCGWAFLNEDKYERGEDIQTRKWRSGEWSPKVPISVLIKRDGATYKLVSFGYKAEKTAQAMEQEDWFYFKRVTFVKSGVGSDDMLEDSAGKRLPAKVVFKLVFQYLKEDIIREIHRLNADVKNIVDDISWVLCFPVIWNDVERQFMKEAALNAGIPGQNIKIVSDSQAASVCCRYPPITFQVERSEKSLKTLRRRNYFILNAEGSSVYLTVHEVINENTVRELHRSRIDYGGNKINDAFKNFLEELFGTDVMSTFKSEYAEDYSDLFRDFEKYKQDTRIIEIRIPMSLLNLRLVNATTTTTTTTPTTTTVNEKLRESIKKSIILYDDSLQVRGDKLYIDFEVIKSSFIITHIKMHNDKLVHDCSVIVMAGWFSDIKFTENCISMRFDVPIIILPDPENAVLKGAVICGHDPKALVVERTDEESDPLFMSKGDQGYYNHSGKKGLMLILNSRENRKGTDEDVKKLKDFFGNKLKFKVYDPRSDNTHDFTTEQVNKQFESVISELNDKLIGKDYYCFICVIMAHGKEGEFNTKDGTMSVEAIRKRFNNHNIPNFTGKPKVFFIQACQGNRVQEAEEMKDLADDMNSSENDKHNYTDESDETIRVPTDADTLLAFATTPGYKSFRRVGESEVGSWFIIECLKEFEKNHGKHHLEDMLITVRQNVAHNWSLSKGGKQMPCVWSTLTMRLMLAECQKD